jgi:NAD(P)-dependent dehydrogenase (short-subunit alcohol dehydrogenase family)
MQNPTTLIIGANSEIAKALATKVINEGDTQLIVVSRNIDFYNAPKFDESNIILIQDYQQASIQRAVNSFSADAELNITKVFICHGLLHNESLQPEKRLSEFSADAFLQVLTANTLTPMLWLSALVPVLINKRLIDKKLTHRNECKIVVFNARVGSISENKLGGWYSYRASKAAMNMLLKSTAVELARSAKNIKLISFHPGTTDSPLSKPFQKNVPKNKLFSSDFVAQQLMMIVNKTEADGEASFLDWQGKTIPW